MMERLVCVVIAILAMASAEAQSSTGAVPSLSDAPLLDYRNITSTTPKPAATIQAPTNAVPPVTNSEGTRGSSAATLTEHGAGHVGETMRGGPRQYGSNTLSVGGRVVKRVLGVGGAIYTVAEVSESLYRAAECKNKGDIAGASKHYADAIYEGASLLPGVGLAQAGCDAIGNVVYEEDRGRKIIVNTIAEQIQQLMEAAAQPSSNASAEMQHRRASRAARFSSMSASNEQAAANRTDVAAQQSGPWSDPQVTTQMMWMLMPAAIAASQQRAIQPPLRAPSSATDPCPPQHFQNWRDGRCVSWNDALGVNRIPTASNPAAGVAAPPVYEYSDGRKLDVVCTPQGCYENGRRIERSGTADFGGSGRSVSGQR